MGGPRLWVVLLVPVTASTTADLLWVVLLVPVTASTTADPTAPAPVTFSMAMVVTVERYRHGC